MSYTVKVRIYQTRTDAYFTIVEKGVWHYANGGTWTETDGIQTLTMGGSGTSGILRFKTEQGTEAFFVALGVHNYNAWVDIVTGLADNVTGVKALPEYYDGSSQRATSREQTKKQVSILNAQSRTIAANYKVGEGHNLELNVVIG